MTQEKKRSYSEARLEIIPISDSDVITTSDKINPDDSLNDNTWDN